MNNEISEDFEIDESFIGKDVKLCVFLPVPQATKGVGGPQMNVGLPEYPCKLVKVMRGAIVVEHDSFNRRVVPKSRIWTIDLLRPAPSLVK